MIGDFKPTIYRHGGGWVCGRIGDVWGLGKTPTDAYFAWESAVCFRISRYLPTPGLYREELIHRI